MHVFCLLILNFGGSVRARKSDNTSLAMAVADSALHTPALQPITASGSPFRTCLPFQVVMCQQGDGKLSLRQICTFFLAMSFIIRRDGLSAPLRRPRLLSWTGLFLSRLKTKTSTHSAKRVLLNFSKCLFQASTDQLLKVRQMSFSKLGIKFAHSKPGCKYVIDADLQAGFSNTVWRIKNKSTMKPIKINAENTV